MSYQNEFWLDISKLCLDISETCLNMIIFQKIMNNKVNGCKVLMLLMESYKKSFKIILIKLLPDGMSG